MVASSRPERATSYSSLRSDSYKQSTQRSKPHKFRPNTRFLGIVLVILVVVGIIGLVAKHNKKPNLNDVHVVISDVSKLYNLPTNETPALATVTDSSKVQASFAGKVKNGDKILIYQTNQKAIVYRPGINKIVDVEPVTTTTGASTTPSTSTAIPNINPFGN